MYTLEGGGPGPRRKGVKADIESITAFANTTVATWADDAHEAHGKVDKLTMGEYSFTDTDGGALYGQVYAAAQRSYKDVLKRAHQDILDAKQALLDSAKVMGDNDDDAKVALARLHKKWASDAGFRSTVVDTATGEHNRKVIEARTQAVGTVGEDVGASDDGATDPGGTTPESHTDKGGETRYQATR